MNKTLDVFISYHHEDISWARAVHAWLELRHFSVWVDFALLRPGDLFAQEIEDAIGMARNVILLCSPAAMTSGWVRQEYYRVIGLSTTSPGGARIIPILINDAELPGFLQTRQYVDWRGSTPLSADMGQVEWGLTGKTPRTRRLSVRHLHDASELRSVWEIDASVYASLAEPYDTLRSWWEAFPSGIYGLFFDSALMGAIGVWPVSKRWIDALALGRVSELSLPITTLKHHCHEPAATWYLAGAALRPIARCSSATQALFRDGISSWANLPLVRYPASLYAIAASPEGQAMLTRSSFTCLRTGTQMMDGKPLYHRQLSDSQEVSRILRTSA